MDEKSKRIGDVVEPTLETATEIENSDEIRKIEQEWFDQFLQGINVLSQQELNDRAIAQVLSEETDNPQMDGKIENIYIDDDERFSKDDVTEEDKGFIKNLIDKTNNYFGGDDDNIDFEVAKSIPLLKHLPLLTNTILLKQKKC